MGANGLRLVWLNHEGSEIKARTVKTKRRTSGRKMYGNDVTHELRSLEIRARV